MAQQFQMGWGDLDQTEPFSFAQHVAQGLGPMLLGQQMDRAARQQRPKERGDREIKGHRGLNRNLFVGTKRISPDAPAQVVDQAAMLDHHALGPAGRAGSVEDVGQVARARGGVIRGT